MATAFIVDCSVSLGWCLGDETGEYAKDVLRELGGTSAHVPALWPLEMANGLLVAERRKRIAEADTMRVLDMIRVLPILVDDETHAHALGTTMALAREYALTAYDAAYLELAMRLDLPLATADRALAKAARESGVARFE